MIKPVAQILVAATGVSGMQGVLHAQTSQVETPRLHVAVGGEEKAQRVVQVQPTTGSVRMVAVCHANGESWTGIAVDAAIGPGRPLPRIGIVSANGTKSAFDTHVSNPGDATILPVAAPTSMRMTQKRPTELFERIARAPDFSGGLGFAGHGVGASFDSLVAALCISAFCDFDPLG
ncbi:MAG: hypothetical protein F4103_00350 [Boseongicola sp. SB0673_bin_14]|nr:hypothetical protein [Boseongicola sp. SB0667_bin_21]MYI67268.1 hypothetical protein [Boseongicola sp. SB0673_bin_14]